MNDETFNRIITVRFKIPFKIVIGAFVSILVGSRLNPEGYSTEVLTMIVDVVLYSTVACILYMVGDYVCYQSWRISKAIYRRFKPKEVNEK